MAGKQGSGRGVRGPHGVTRARVAELLERGLTQSEIGRLLGIRRQAVHAHVIALREDHDGKRIRAKVSSMLERGITPAEIQIILGMSREDLAQHMAVLEQQEKAS